MTHALKTWPQYFKDVTTWHKNFEVRKYDRPFKVGETLLLQEWDNEKFCYTGNQCERTIGYILEGGQFGIEDGYVVLGLKDELF